MTRFHRRLVPAFGLLLLAMALPARAAAESCYDKAQTQADLTACSAENLKDADGELDGLYRQILVRLSGDAAAQKALTQAQRAWLDFRDEECRFATLKTGGGSVYLMTLNECRARVTRNRVGDLRDALGCAASAPDEQTAAECTVPASPKAPGTP